MHRSLPLVLAVVAASAACSTQKDPQGTRTLSQDSTLAARIDDYQKTDKQTQKQSFPDACGTFTIPHPTAATKAEAQEISRQGETAEMLGNMQDASSLFRRASDLDGTNKSAAYHLGRVSEALSDRASAIHAYCRYLALSPTSAEAVEARQRVLNLSQPQTQLAAAPTPRPAQKQRIAETHRAIARTEVDHSVPITQPKRAPRSTTTVASGAIDLPSEAKPVTPPLEHRRQVDTVSSESDGVETAPAVPAPAQPQSERRGPSRAQSAGIGAVAGAILGGVTGRSMKAAVIGAAAGGVLGGVLPRGSRRP